MVTVAAGSASAESSFDFLRSRYPLLFESIHQSEVYLGRGDPTTSLFWSRKFAEALAKMTADQTVQILEDNLDTLIEHLISKRVFPSEIASAMHQIRRAGNLASHVHDKARTGDARMAEDALRQSYLVAVWFFSHFGRDPLFRPGPYLPPVASAAPTLSPPVLTATAAEAACPSESSWIIRPYPHHKDRTREFLSGSIIAVGWGPIGDIAHLDKQQILTLLKRHYHDRAKRWHMDLGVLLRFRDDIREGDIVAMVPRLEHGVQVALGRVIGAYFFEPTVASGEFPYPHQRRVQWLGKMVSRYDLPVTAQKSMTQGTLNRTPCVLRTFLPLHGWLP